MFGVLYSVFRRADLLVEGERGLLDIASPPHIDNW